MIISSKGVRMEPDSKVMLIFVGFAVAIGIICGLADVEPVQGLLLAFLSFYASYKVAPNILDLEETSFETGAWNIIKTGILPYWFIWLVFWTLVYTLKV